MDDTFGARLRAQMSDENTSHKATVLANIPSWIEDEVLANLTTTMEEAAGKGKTEVIFRHTYEHNVRVNVEEIEKLPSYLLLKQQCDHLGLGCLAMSHALLTTRDPAVYPCLEIKVSLPPLWQITHGGA